MELIWIAVLGLAVLVVEAYRYVRVERIQESCRQSLQNIRNSHDELMRQTRNQLEGEYSKRIEGLQLQLANRDEVIQRSEKTILESRQKYETSIKNYAEEISILSQELKRLHESDASNRRKLNHAEQQNEKLLSQARKARTLLEF